MIRNMYAIVTEMNEDEKVAYPVPFENDEMAKLWFNTHLASTPMMRQAPDQYSLMLIGSWDSTSGTIIQDPKKHLKIIMKGANPYGN